MLFVLNINSFLIVRICLLELERLLVLYFVCCSDYSKIVRHYGECLKLYDSIAEFWPDLIAGWPRPPKV
jgi:hypothetical protein